MATTAQNPSVKNLVNLGICGIEALWLYSVLGTSYLRHPVAQRRARGILDQANVALKTQQRFYQVAGQIKAIR